MQVAEPFLCHQIPAVLSMRNKVARSFTTKHWTTQSLWTTPPASSNLELLTVPCGFVQLTRVSTISFWKVTHHTMDCAPLEFGEGHESLGCGGNYRGIAVGPGNTTTPFMYLGASWQPSTVSRRGTISYMPVGRLATASDNHLKSSKDLWTPMDRVTLLHLTCQRTSCIWLNNPLAPGRASAIERSLPRTRCHFLKAYPVLGARY